MMKLVIVNRANMLLIFFQKVVKNDETALTELPIQDYTALNDFGASF